MLVYCLNLPLIFPLNFPLNLPLILPLIFSFDIFDPPIGREAYYLENYWHTKEWMLECLRKMDEENDYEDVSLPEIYDFLAFSEYKVR